MPYHYVATAAGLGSLTFACAFVFTFTVMFSWTWTSYRPRPCPPPPPPVPPLRPLPGRQGSVADGAVAQDITQLRSMWSLREHAPVAVSLAGHNYKYDVSVKVGDFRELAEETRRRLSGLCSPEAVVVAYGHLGDGNLHLNVCVPHADSGGGGDSDGEGGGDNAGSSAVLNALEPFVFEWVVSRGGSISAEHGVGQHKRDYLPMQRPAAAIEVMRGIKGLLDPRGIMNPFKVLPAQEASLSSSPPS